MNVRVPIIPTFIIVHLGAPDVKADNISVPFAEYIKNVASSEIYPSWPKESLKANILAQISFALNRIYNEWYRSKGYDFDITNSPIYDQNFIPDRQFFETISDIVDDLFNDYIIRNNQIQPLYATYCDGLNSTCDGLLQWQTIDLANQGLNALEILKYFYGNDISIVTNAPVKANISTYPGFAFEIGSAGEMVRTIEKELNRISNNYPAIPIINDVSEFFTIETKNAVLSFQNIFNLPQTGTVDKGTWYKIKYIYNAVKQITDLYSEGISKDDADYIYEDKLEYGDKGFQIETLGYLLSVIAYFDDDIPFLPVTNEFNDNLEEMVIAFQKKYGLPETGDVDAITWNRINEIYRMTLNSIPDEYLKYKDELYPGKFLSKGMTGEDVLRLQEYLYTICEKFHNIPGVKTTGIYDDLTEESIMVLQESFQIFPSGVVGPATWYEIVELSKK